MIGFDRLARLDVAEHRCSERRAFCGQHPCRAFQRRRAGRIAFRDCDRPAFVENAKQEVLAAGRRQDHADRGAHQAGRGRDRREEHPFLPHVLQDGLARRAVEIAASDDVRDGANPV